MNVIIQIWLSFVMHGDLLFLFLQLIDFPLVAIRHILFINDLAIIEFLLHQLSFLLLCQFLLMPFQLCVLLNLLVILALKNRFILIWYFINVASLDQKFLLQSVLSRLRWLQIKLPLGMDRSWELFKVGHFFGFAVRSLFY